MKLKNLIERFNSIKSLKVNLENEITDTELIIKEYSNLLGEKIRANEESSADDPDFLALKEKLQGNTSDDKSKDKKSKDKKSKDKKEEIKKSPDKKKKPKKGLSDKWFNLNEILVYNGMGVKGELELYFKAIDQLKSKLENLQRTLLTLNNVIEKGLKEDMACVTFRGTEGILEIAFLKATGSRENFSLKSIYSGAAIPVENMIKIGV
jgi:chemotaxis protein histidine kinase CheA